MTDEFLHALGNEDFRGPLWHGLSAVLAGYGIAVITSWIKDARIFTELTGRGIRHEPATAEHHYPRNGDAASLASETVARALDRLRILLRSRQWSADGSAPLHDRFMEQCLRQFPDVYRRWRRENEPLLPAADAMAGGTDGRSGGDPAVRMISARSPADLMSKIPDDLRAVIQLRADGVPLADIPEQLGWRTGSLENALVRHRRRLRAADQGKG
jgi:hypothetical protein